MRRQRTDNHSCNAVSDGGKAVWLTSDPMDEALRCLRDGVVDGRPALFVLVQDSLNVLGGPALAAKVR